MELLGVQKKEPSPLPQLIEALQIPNTKVGILDAGLFLLCILLPSMAMRISNLCAVRFWILPNEVESEC